jgi:hypothetical protein
MKNNKHVESFEKFNENLNISDVMNSYIMQISNDFQEVADKYDLIQVADTLDYEGEFAESFEGSIYSVNIWIKDENLPPYQRKVGNQRIVIAVMFDTQKENSIDIDNFKKDCIKSLKGFNIESMKFTQPEEFTQIKTFEICIKI